MSICKTMYEKIEGTKNKEERLRKRELDIYFSLYSKALCQASRSKLISYQMKQNNKCSHESL